MKNIKDRCSCVPSVRLQEVADKAAQKALEAQRLQDQARCCGTGVLEVEPFYMFRYSFRRVKVKLGSCARSFVASFKKYDF